MDSEILTNVVKLDAPLSSMPDTFTDVAAMADELQEQLMRLEQGAIEREQLGVALIASQAGLSTAPQAELEVLKGIMPPDCSTSGDAGTLPASC